MRSRTDRKRLRRTPMTLDEALRIEQQAARGAIDLSSPHAAAIVDEAHRVHLTSELWGADATSRRRTKRVVGAGVAFVTATILGLVACLAFTQ